MSTTTAPTIELLALTDVEPHPKNIRRDLGDLTELTASVRADGVKTPIHVAPTAGGDRYVVLAGHRRRQASLDAGLTTIPAIIRGDVTTDAAALVEMLVENLQRLDLTPVEEAAAYEQLQLAGLKPAAIAKRTGRGRKTVDARLALLDLPEQTREKIHARQVSIEEAVGIGEFADDPAAVQRLEQDAGSTEFAFTLERLRAEREDRAKTDAAVQRLAADGIRTLTDKDLKGQDRWKYHLGYVLTGNYGTPLERQISDHGACPGHTALVGTGGSVSWLCTEPGNHKTDREQAAAGRNGVTVTESQEQAREREAQAEARRAEETTCAATQTVRLDWLRAITSQKKPFTAAQADIVGRLVVQLMLDGYLECTETARWLWLVDGALVDEVLSDDAEDLLPVVLRERPQLRVLLAGIAAEEESDLVQPFHWNAGWVGQHIAYLDALVALGYAPSEWEQTRIDAAHASVAEADDEQDSDEGDGVEDVVDDL